MNLDHLINRKPDEKVIFYTRRHVVVFVGELLLISVLALIPLLGYYLIGAAWPALLTSSVSRPILVLMLSAYYLNLWLFFLSNFVDYYLDAWIVTDDRILNVEQHGLFSRTISELDLVKIQDVTSEVKGFFPYLFNFGDVFIQTAGETRRFQFEQVPRPHEIRKHILGLVEEDRKRQGETKPAGE